MNKDTLSARYDASLVEERIYSMWKAAGLFKPDPNPAKAVFSITIPPPNVTGSLHMGHALCYPIQDAIGRYRRLMGDSVMILPGQDHAGIATQGVVARNLKKEGLSPTALGREKFVEKVWEWRHQSGGEILRQLRRLGCAFDWSRERFTLDDDYADAVLDVFIDWFDRGLIYLGERVVNWDPALETSVSDIETERVQTKGKLYHVRYPFADGSGHIVVATTRPETMLGDVAVAVHPGDDRYKKLVGKMLVLPLLGREIPLIADPYPDPAFGTGAVKITPAHDPNDFEVGVRHDLAPIVVLDSKAKVNSNGGPYEGLDRYEARKRIIADLEAADLLERIEDHDIAMIVSERSGEAIEPLLREEWFVSQSELAKPAIEAARGGQISFVPERYKEIYLDWMENLRDWNISRNLWWGHRIPVYYTASGKAVAAKSWEAAEAKAGEPIASQDDRVLDTWFSSGLWPFATLGWPKDTEDLRRFYPTDVLVTSREILFLWVARMVMMGLDRVGDIPFRNVYIYATVLTESGRRMSKSLGTGVDPMTIIETKGADALRYTLFSQTGHNQDIRYSEKRTDDARNLCNKMWNAARFIYGSAESKPDSPGELQLVDKWMLSRLVRAERDVRLAYDNYNLQEACSILYRLFWNDLCDWYIEISKQRLSAGETAPRWVLFTVLEAFLKMMHPIMPFITEELYQHLPVAGKAECLMAASWPALEPHFESPEEEVAVERAIGIVRGIRALRAELGITPMKTIPSVAVVGDIAGLEGVIRSQAWVDTIDSSVPNALSVFDSIEGVEIHLPVGDLLDEGKLRSEAARMAKEIEKLGDERSQLAQRLGNPGFLERAKPEVVAEARAQLESIDERIERFKRRIASFTAG